MLDYIKYLIKRSFKSLRSKTPQHPQLNHLVWGSMNDTTQRAIPKRIWIFWDNVTIDSETVQLCINQIEVLHRDYDIRILNSQNIRQYIEDSPPASLEKLYLSTKSDWLRLKLLSKYGGIYLDASVWLTENLDWIRELQNLDKSELVGYYTRENTVDSSFPIMENWMLACSKSQFIDAWLREFEKCLRSEEPKTYYEQYKEFVNISLSKSYYMAYYAAQKVMRENDNYRITLIEADRDAYLYSLGIKTKWSDVALAEILLLNRKAQKFPKMIKIIGGSRKTLDLYLNKGRFSKKSILGSFMDRGI